LAKPAYIVLVDDETDLAEAFAEFLDDLNYDTAIANGAARLDLLLAQRTPDLLVLDLAMPGEDGRSILKRLKPGLAAPVVILTSAIDEIDRIACIEIGADDFVTKPVEPRELAARIGALLHRYGTASRRLLRFETCTADLGAARVLHDDGRTVRLQPGEIQLLVALVEGAGRPMSREELIERAPAEDRHAFNRAIDKRIARLRQKLGTQRLTTVRGNGYLLELQA
jgi:DNA-binding response OmpR family regulator